MNPEETVAASVMSTPLITVKPDDTLSDVEALLVRAGIGGVPVLDRGQLVGIVTRSDFVRIPALMKSLDGYVEECLQRMPRPDDLMPFEASAANLLVKDVMVRQVLTCAPDTPVSTIAATMVRRHVHRVIVVDDGVPVGIVESLDLLAALTGQKTDALG